MITNYSYPTFRQSRWRPLHDDWSNYELTRKHKLGFIRGSYVRVITTLSSYENKIYYTQRLHAFLAKRTNSIYGTRGKGKKKKKKRTNHQLPGTILDFQGVAWEVKLLVRSNRWREKQCHMICTWDFYISSCPFCIRPQPSPWYLLMFLVYYVVTCYENVESQKFHKQEKQPNTSAKTFPPCGEVNLEFFQKLKLARLVAPRRGLSKIRRLYSEQNTPVTWPNI